MPELPELEVLRRQLAAPLAGARVSAVWTDDHPRFTDATTLPGALVERVRRRGKYLILVLDDGREAVVHLGMTGQVSLAAPDDADPAHLRVRLQLRTEDGGSAELRLADTRKFGRFTVVDAGDYSAMPTLARLGPEPLSDDFTAGGFARALAARHATVKAVLLEQRAVAGVGNWIADESLHAAAVHPSMPASGLDGDAAQRLHAALVRIIARAVEAGGTSFSDYVHADGTSTGSNTDNLVCYGRAGLPCTTCGSPLSKAKLAGRGTTWCASCQERA